MTPTASPSPAPPAPPADVPPTFVAPPRTQRSGGRRVAIWLGGAVAVFGAILALGGGAIIALFGSDGVLSTGRHDLSTPTSALVSQTASIEDTADVADALGDTRVKVSAHADGGRPVFVGIGRADDVERYLDGAATDEVTDFDVVPFRVDRDRHEGDVTPQAPGEQSFWIASDSGRDAANLDWKVRDGDYRFVVMNADGSRGVATQSKLGVDVPYIGGVGIGILGAGLVLVAGGIAAIVLGARRPRS
jgi:hypothetical protein